jgi:hypothetical protein
MAFNHTKTNSKDNCKQNNCILLKTGKLQYRLFHILLQRKMKELTQAQ